MKSSSLTLAKITAMINRIFFLFLITFMSYLSYAQESEQTADTLKMNSSKLLDLSFEDLMNVRVITPTQSLQQSRQVPASVIVVTNDQIKLRGYRNLGEILNDLPDFIVNDKSDPQFYNVATVRGIYRQDHFVILLDGTRISSPTNEPLPLLENFPIYLAKQIEVVYGPGSALYGADAMAGVINIITQKAGDQEAVAVTAMGGTQGYGNTTAFFNKKFENDLRLAAGGQYSYDAQPDFSKIYKNDFSMDAQRAGVFNTVYGPLNPQQSINPKYDAPIKAYNVYTSIEKDRFAMRILHHYIEVPTSTTFSSGNAVFNKDVFYGQSVTTGSASYSTARSNLKSISTLVGSVYKVNPQSNFRNIYGKLEHGYKYSTGSMVKADQQLNYTISKKINLIGGLTYELFQSIPKSPELQFPVDGKGAVSGILLNTISANNPAGIEAKFFPLLYTNIGAYLQCQYFPVDNLSFTIGVRRDKNSRFGSTVNPRAGAVFSPFEKTTIKVLYGTAFWAPSPLVSFESYGSFYTSDDGVTYQSAYWHLPNPNLKPMTSQTAELSIVQKIGKDFNMILTGYRTKIDNIISNVPDNGNTNLYDNKFLGWRVDYIEVPFNLGEQKNYGGKLMINNTFHIGQAKLNAYASLSYVEGKVSASAAGANEVEQATITPCQFRIGFDGKLNAFHFSVRLLRAGEQRLSGFDPESAYKRQTINGYSLLNASAGYTVKGAIFFVNVQNALNEHYRNPLPGGDLTATNAATFNGSYQDPMRAIMGIRVSF